MSKNLNKIILGSAQFGLSYGINNTNGKLLKSDVLCILETAYNLGLRTVDTAEAYGDSQSRIGMFHKKYPNKSFRVITKFINNSVNKLLSDKIVENKQLLNVNLIHGYMFHNYTALKKYPFLYSELQKLKNKSLVEKIGISLYKNLEIEDIISNYSFDFIQIPFNLLDNDYQRGDILRKAKSQGIEVHTRSNFLQGLFFKPLKNIDKRFVTIVPHLQQLHELCTSYNVEMTHLALAYAVEKNYIDNIVIGVDSVEQLKKILK